MGAAGHSRSHHVALAIAAVGTAVVGAWALVDGGVAGTGAAASSPVPATHPVASPWPALPSAAASAPWTDPAPATLTPGPGGAVAAPPAGSGAAPWPPAPITSAAGAAAIVWGTPAPHADRGTCADCHAMLTRAGAPVPPIRSTSFEPHERRGVCGNCHHVVVGAGMPVAGVAVQPQVPAQPTEAEWLGLEVRAGPGGVEVAGVEGAAATSGLTAGDVVTSINAAPVADLATFVDVTRNGTLDRGAVIASRRGQRLAFEVGAPAGGAAGASPPGPGLGPAQARF